MGKKAKTSSRRESNKLDFQDEHINSSSRNFVYDEVDDYYENEEQAGMQKLEKLMKKPKLQRDNEVLGVASSSEDEFPVPKLNKKKKKKKVDMIPQKADLGDMASDIEDQTEDQIDTRAWGKKKSTFYSRDKIDSHQINSDEEEMDAAVLEEQEALNLQKRMLEDLEESDFGLGYLLPKKDAVQEQPSSDRERVQTDLSVLSSREQLEILKKESPELLELIEDFKSQLNEARRLSPLIALQHQIPSTPGLALVQTKFQLIVNYCTNVSYYLILKARKQPGLSTHPVIKRLVQFRGLLQQLAPVENKCKKSLEAVLKKLNSGEEIVWEEKAPEEKRAVVNVKPKKLLGILKPKNVEIPTEEGLPPVKLPKEKKNAQKRDELTADEKAALELYEAIKSGKSKPADVEAEEDSQDEESPSHLEDENQTEEGTVEKRGINYQIAKNKGLTPHRKKEQRNPRVKHRAKFRKALIRRKGQVRTTRTEVRRYDGEFSGIKASVVRSVKLKT